MTSGSDVVLDRRGPISVVRLNRPEARNALTPGVVSDLGAAIVEAESDPDIRALVLTGTGDRAFCAGMDLRSFAAGAVPGLGADASTTAFHRLLRGETSVPIVGAANASAVAGGLELLLGCDLVVASSAARFGLPEVQRGLFAAGSGTALARRIPMAVALEIVLTGELFSATRAYEVGLVNAVVAPEEVLATALAYAERIAGNAPLGVAAGKALVPLWVTDAHAAAARLDEWRAKVFASEDAAEGAAAFMEKRAPVWRGR